MAVVLVAPAACEEASPPASNTSDQGSSGGSTSATSGGDPAMPTTTGVADDGTSGPGSTSITTGDGSSDDGGPVTGCREGTPLAPPSASWTPIASGFVGVAGECTQIAALVAQPCSTRVVVGVENGGLWHSDDAGESWSPLGDAPGSAVVDHRPMSITFDPRSPETMWSAGIYGTHGVYASLDDGATFAAMGDMTFSQLVAVDFGDPDRATLVVGTHGQPQQVHHSSDGGLTWTNVGANLPAEAHNSESPVVIDANTFLVGACGYGDGVCGIYRTTDAGATWSSVSDLQISHFGGPLRTRDGVLYWPLFGEGGLARSADDGQTWTQVVTGTVFGVTPLELPDGSIATLSSTAVVRSDDGGASWQPLTDAFAPLQTSLDAALTYSTGAQAFFVVRRDCGGAIDGGILRAGYAMQ